jgi:hypothetical protein
MNRGGPNPQTLRKCRHGHPLKVIAFQNKLTAPVELLHALVNKESGIGLHLVARYVGDLFHADFADGDVSSLAADLIDQAVLSNGDEVTPIVGSWSLAVPAESNKFNEDRLVHIVSQAEVWTVAPQYCQQVRPEGGVKTREGINVIRRLKTVPDQGLKVQLGSDHGGSPLQLTNRLSGYGRTITAYRDFNGEGCLDE